MSSKAEQHKKFIGMILINHPLLNKGEPFEVRIEAPERERDAEKNLISLDAKGKLMQTTHASIIRLFSKWDGDYVLEGFDKLVKEVIPSLNQAYTQLAGQAIEFTWADNLAFRKMQELPNGEIYGSSGEYNPTTGEWDEAWLTEEWFTAMQAFRKSPLFYSVKTEIAPVETAKKASEPVDLSFLQVAKVAPATKTTKKK